MLILMYVFPQILWKINLSVAWGDQSEGSYKAKKGLSATAKNLGS